MNRSAIARLAGHLFVVLGIWGAVFQACGNTAADAPVSITESRRHMNFESGPVRPLALSPDGNTVARVNIPNGTLELLDVQANGQLQRSTNVKVGLDPVAVAFRNDTEVWVVNHLSDSVSVIDLSGQPFVRETLLVGDEPRDIVFARDQAFITTAHRGQRLEDPALAYVPGAGDPELTTPGIGRADVWVFDAADTKGAAGGVPTKIVNLFGDTPRPLAVSPDGSKVYAGIHFSGNQTSVIRGSVFLSSECGGYSPSNRFQEQGEYLKPFEASVPCDGNGAWPNVMMPRGLEGGLYPGKLPGPATNAFGEPAPPTSLIVKYDNNDGIWKDVLGRNWNNAMRFNLPDYDVFEIDTDTLAVGSQFSHAGTILFNMATNPVNGKVYVSNTDANNLTRFEGPGIFAGSTVQGEIAKSQITVVDPTFGTVTPTHLNSHIDYDQRPALPEVKDHSLATPLDMVVSSDGAVLYVAAFGSGKVGVFPTADIEAGRVDPRSLSQNYIDVTGGGPSGLVLNEAKGVMYVSTRFDNGLSTVNLLTNQEIDHLAFETPESPETIDGRFMLYDASATSSNGEASCASCHVFGDVDHLAWDLGNPDEPNTRNPQPIVGEIIPITACLLAPPSDGWKLDDCEVQATKLNGGGGDARSFSSIKGPMTTQTLKGMQNHGNTHWRADRANGYFYSDEDQTLDAKASFINFIGAFPDLLGMDVELPESVEAEFKTPEVVELEENTHKFADFMFNTYLPPNPIRNLDNSLTANQQLGFEFYEGDNVDGSSTPGFGFNCNDCHTIDPEQGLFGSNAKSSFTIEGAQIFKIPQTRNFYTKIGMFGDADRQGAEASTWGQHQGDQIRGFGSSHDGAALDLVRLLQTHNFIPLHDSAKAKGHVVNDVLYALQDFVFASPSDVAPITGQQLTLDAASSVNFATRSRLALFKERAATPFVSKELGLNLKKPNGEPVETHECFLTGRGKLNGADVAVSYDPVSDTFLNMNFDLIVLPDVFPPGDHITFTCNPDAYKVRPQTAGVTVAATP